MKKRKARIGLIAIVMLMLAIVLLLISLFWLTAFGPWSKNPSDTPTQVNEKEETPISSAPIDNITIEEAILELKKAGCTVTTYEKTIYLRDAKRLNYYEFREKAIINGLVIILPNESGDYQLLVTDNVNEWVYRP